MFKMFFPIVDTCFSCEDIAWQNSTMVPRWRVLAIFCVLYFQGAACSTFQTYVLNSHYHTVCGSMVDIQSATAEIRRGQKNKKKERKKPQDKNIMSASATQGGHKERCSNT